MNKKEKFSAFLESLKGQKQDALIESISKSFQVCCEGITDEEFAEYVMTVDEPDTPDDAHYIKAGETIINLLDLNMKENGRVDTMVGDKTPLGLAKTVQRIMDEGGI